MPPELFPRPAFSITPEPGRSGPKLWVRRLVIWQEPGKILRDISLRPGLNIIWSPDSETPDSPIGHGAGKTTFCRLLRFCLGEDSFAPDELRYRIGEVFPKGYVGAEAVLDSQTWIVVRALGHRRRDIAQEGGSFDDALAEDRKPTGMAHFRQALTNAIMGNSAMLVPSSIGLEGAWKALLAWTARDQECRLSHVLSWRSADSDSQSPVVNRSAEDKLLVVRAAIGALSKSEVTSQQKEDRQSNRLAGHRSYLNRLEWQIGRTRRTLSSSLGRSGTLSPGTPIGLSLWKKSAADRLSKALALPIEIDPQNIAQARRDRDVAKDEVSRLEGEHNVLKIQIDSKQQLRTGLMSELPQAHAKYLTEKHPICPICKVPIDQALAKGCGLSSAPCDLHALQMEISRKRQRITDLGQEILQLQRQGPVLDTALGKAKDHFQKINLGLSKLEHALDASSRSILDAQRLVDDIQKYEALVAEYDKARLSDVKMDDEVKRTRDAIASYRDSTSSRVARLSDRFDGILRELVSPDIKGSLKIDGKGLKLNVELGGNRSTAAIDSLKIVAFDLAVLVMSMEERLFVAGLLVHDSPREADLTNIIYGKLFPFAAKLESCTEFPLFQYIITTTTAPPETFKTDQWIRLQVKGAPASERLLRTDL